MSDLTTKQEGAPSVLSEAQQSAALDHRVAVEIMGWESHDDPIVRDRKDSHWDTHRRSRSKYGWPTVLIRKADWSPSTDIADAWTVVEQMANWPLGYASGFACEITVLPLAGSLPNPDIRVKCSFKPAVWMMGDAPEPSELEDVSKWLRLSELPRAITIAALAAIEQESKT